MAALRNLQSHINKLNQEFQRQQELLYNAEYQIQLLERAVARAHGEKTNEETQQLKEELSVAKEENAKVRKEHNNLEKALQKLIDDQRNLGNELKSHLEEREKYKSKIHSLILENEMTFQDLNNIIKIKEDQLVFHDIRKLDIKKIKDR